MRTTTLGGRLLRVVLGALAGIAAVAVVATPFLVRHDAPLAARGVDPVTIPMPDPQRDPGRPLLNLRPPVHGILLGVSNFDLVEADGAVRAWTRANGPRPRIVNWFQQWQSGERRFRPDWAHRVARAGAVPMITWEPWYAPSGEKHVVTQPDVAAARIADGDFDAYIRAWARDVAAYRGPVLIRLMHEMNGTWYPWGVHVNGNTPADFVRAWRHVHRIFDRAGARNVSWVWSINNLEAGSATETTDIAPFYPGRRWVDWVSTSGFNWGTAYSWSTWRTADQLYRDTYDALARFGKPIMISEIGTTADGGDARAWVRQTFARLRTDYPRLHAVLWYDEIDGGGLDFRLRGPLAGALEQPGGLGSGWVRSPRFARQGAG